MLVGKARDETVKEITKKLISDGGKFCEATAELGTKMGIL